ncbi:MAG: S-layer homology domain-containing protein [Clostridiales bacterium]|nr:S-layer homology domain-containing protein [Clostridiales bacterium]
MKVFLKALAISALAASLMTVSASAAETAFPDVDPETKQGAAIEKMYEAGCVAGYEDGTFRPDGSITRAELVRIMNLTLQFEQADETAVSVYSDVVEGAWYYNDLLIAQEQGYVAGFPDGTFRPGENITRQQFCTIVSQLFGFEPSEEYTEVVSDEITGWASDYVYAVLASGVMELEENNTFRATQNITRGEVCLAAAQFLIQDNISEIISSVISDTDTDSETATTDSSSSSSSSSGGGGSSSGSSSSGSSSSSETTTTTDSSSETTTSSSSSSSSGSSSSGSSSGSSSSTDNETETTTEAAAETTTVDDDTITALNKVYNNLYNAQLDAPNTAVRNIIRNIRTYIKSYLNDHDSVDIDAAGDDIKAQYKALSDSNKTALQDLVLENCSLSDLSKLKNVFFPNLSL